MENGITLYVSSINLVYVLIRNHNKQIRKNIGQTSQTSSVFCTY